jgi:hypothetical protein
MAYVVPKVRELHRTGDRKQVLWNNWQESKRKLATNTDFCLSVSSVD